MSATITEITWPSVRKIKWAWATASSSSGATTATTTNAFAGQILGALFSPGASASQPTASYDVTVTDSDGFDVLLGAGANLSNAANVYKKAASLAAVALDKLTINVSGAGSSHSGTVILFVR